MSLKVGRYQKKIPTFPFSEKGTYLLGGWGKILKVPFNLQFFLLQKINSDHQFRTFFELFPLYYHWNIHDFISCIKFMIFICQAASKSAELCCWLLCKCKDMLITVIKNELEKQIFFQKCPCFDKEGRWENKIINVPN